MHSRISRSRAGKWPASSLCLEAYRFQGKLHMGCIWDVASANHCFSIDSEPSPRLKICLQEHVLLFSHTQTISCGIPSVHDRFLAEQVRAMNSLCYFSQSHRTCSPSPFKLNQMHKMAPHVATGRGLAVLCRCAGAVS